MQINFVKYMWWIIVILILIYLFTRKTSKQIYEEIPGHDNGPETIKKVKKLKLYNDAYANYALGNIYRYNFSIICHKS